MTIVTGHQPAYLPWLGLIHKASLADVFVYIDDVQYLEQDWNNRNQVKTPQGGKKWLTVPVDLKNSASRTLKDIRISTQLAMPEAKRWQAVHLQTLQSLYGGCRYYKDYKGFFEDLYRGRVWESLSELNLTILRQMFSWFGVTARVEVASRLGFTQKKSDLVLEHALRFKADVVVTGVFGKDYIKLEDFASRGIKVVFQEYKHPTYEQRFGPFVSHLSFVDLLFQHGPDSRPICSEGNVSREEIERG